MATKQTDDAVAREVRARVLETIASMHRQTGVSGSSLSLLTIEALVRGLCKYDRPAVASYLRALSDQISADTTRKTTLADGKRVAASKRIHANAALSREKPAGNA